MRFFTFLCVRERDHRPTCANSEALQTIGRVACGAKRVERKSVLVGLQSAYLTAFRTSIRVLIGRDNGWCRLR